jgi:hypothetical protein
VQKVLDGQPAMSVARESETWSKSNLIALTIEKFALAF